MGRTGRDVRMGLNCKRDYSFAEDSSDHGLAGFGTWNNYRMVHSLKGAYHGCQCIYSWLAGSIAVLNTRSPAAEGDDTWLCQAELVHEVISSRMNKGNFKWGRAMVAPGHGEAERRVWYVVTPEDGGWLFVNDASWADYSDKMPRHNRHKGFMNRNCSHESQSSLTHMQCRNNHWSCGRYCISHFHAISQINSPIFQLMLFRLYAFCPFFHIWNIFLVICFYRTAIWEKT